MAFSFLLPIASNVRPAGAATVGETVDGQIVVGSKQIPLPHGPWEVAAQGTQDLDRPELGAFGAIENVVLFRRHGRRVVAVAEINTNSVPVDNGWGPAPSCERGGQFLLLTRYRSGWDLSCMLVQPTYAPTGGPGPRAWRGALRAAAVAGLAVPDLWLTAAFRVSDRQDLVDVRYHFAPGLLIDRLGQTANGRQDWAAAAVSADARRLAAVRLLSSWAVGADEWIERGLRNQLDGGATLDMPRRAAFFSNTPQIDAKLRDLERLHRSGALPVPEYLEQQRAALGEVPVLAEDSGAIGRTVEKSLSLRAVNSLVDHALAFAVAVNAPVVSGWLAVPATLAYSTVFVLNDRLWEAHWAQRGPHDAARAVEFVHLGVPA
ncbi:MAG TPA: hypothetical protein VFY87_19295 [Geminicoccaceae bacterium]|nr:hypothetical protein [Geminicoccaceae bacterium]